MTEKRLWEFVTRKTQMYAGLDETKMEHNWGSVASAAALLREMLTLLRGERENALRAATKAQEAQQRENLTATQVLTYLVLLYLLTYSFYTNGWTITYVLNASYLLFLLTYADEARERKDEEEHQDG